MESILKQNKKAQISALSSSVLALVVAIIILVLGLVMIQEIRDTPVVAQANSASTVNETLVTVTEAGEILAGSSSPGAVCSVGTVTNSTSGTVIPTTNFTTSNNGCTLSFTSGDSLGINNSNWNVTYSHTFGDEAFIGSNASLVGLGDFADFIPLIVIAIAASIVIGLILVGFAFGRRER